MPANCDIINSNYQINIYQRGKMKIYATVITIIAVLALATIGYGYYTGIKIKKVVLQYQNTIQQLKDENNQKSKEISNLAMLLRDATSSLSHAGDAKFSSINPASIDKINQNLINISSDTSRQEIQSQWNAFKQTLSLNDYRSFVQTIADTIKNETVVETKND